MAPITFNITKAQRAANAANLRNVRLAGFASGLLTGNATMIIGVALGVKVYQSLKTDKVVNTDDSIDNIE